MTAIYAPDLVGETAVMTSATAADLDGVALTDLRTFGAAVTAGKLASGGLVYVRVWKDASNWAIWLATYTDAATDTIVRATDVETVGTLANTDVVNIRVVDPGVCAQAAAYVLNSAAFSCESDTTGSEQSFSQNEWSPMTGDTLNATLIDRESGLANIDTSSDVSYTIPAGYTGLWFLAVQAAFDQSNLDDGDNFGVRLYDSGNALALATALGVAGANATAIAHSVNTIVKLDAGDVIEAQAKCSNVTPRFEYFHNTFYGFYLGPD